jgi:hypothetical protein
MQEVSVTDLFYLKKKFFWLCTLNKRLVDLIASCDTIRIGEQFNSILCFSICFYHKHTVSIQSSILYLSCSCTCTAKKGVIKASPYGTVNLLLSLLGSLKKNFCKKKNWCWCQILLIKFLTQVPFSLVD